MKLKELTGLFTTSLVSLLELLNGNNRSKYVTVTKGLKIQELSGFDVVKFSK